jgi:signal transduction histidine kinase
MIRREPEPSAPGTACPGRAPVRARAIPLIAPISRQKERNAPVIEAGLVDRLAAHTTLREAPREELAWLATHGALREFSEGDVVSHKGQPVEGLYILLSGCVAIFVDRGAGMRKVMAWCAGDITGLLPYSRLVGPPGDSVVQEPTTVLEIHSRDFPELIRECPTVTSILVHKMVDRARVFTTSGLHDEKMVSLGKLSAGLAHELNNPASAIERGAALLSDRLQESEMATRALGAANLGAPQLAAVDAVRASCLATRAHGVLSPIQQADRENSISDWLTGHDVDEALAGALAETSVTLDALDQIALAVSGPPLEAVLRSVAAECSVRSITSEIQEAAMRISGLVTAIKGFTHMDQATVAEPVDLASSLGNTVTVLRAKARSKSVAVSVNVEPDLPRVRGFAGELNQVWANLIDNALDAVPEAGKVEVTARRERQRVVVRVVDNGTGIPPEIRDRLFEPFVTTKPVGQGTGLGLDIVRRLITHNNAEIDVESRPGRTEFRVSLPVAETAATGNRP